jgi:hypothetical protein
VDPVPDSLLLRKCGSAGNRTGTSGLAARNSDHRTTEAVTMNTHGAVMDLRRRSARDVWILVHSLHKHTSCKTNLTARFVVFIAVTMENAVFWDIKP